MAKLQIGLGAGDFQWVPEMLALPSLSNVNTKTANTFAYTNGNGDTVTVTGNGFTYSGNQPTGGTISKIVVTNGADTLVTIELLNHPLAPFTQRLLDNDPFQALRGLMLGNDELRGTSENDNLGGYSPGDDIVRGFGSDDYIEADQGNDNLDGGDGFDTLSYIQTFFDKSAKKGLKLTVSKGTVKDPWGNTDTFANFESYWATAYKDKLIGSAKNEDFLGLKGNDVIDGKGGFDVADYSWDARWGKGKKGIKADFVKGEVRDGYGDVDKIKNIESVRGTAKSDTFIGDKKNNNLQGLDGKDKYDGGKGFDELNFSANDWHDGKNGVSVNAAQGKVLDDGYGNAEKFKNIEGFTGTKFGDTFVGSKKAEEFWGEDGNDIMTGGKGADKFVFRPPPDNSTNRDVITDFNQAEGDKIAFSKPDGFPQLNNVNGGLDPAQFVANAGGNPTNANQRIVYDTATGKLWLDPDGNASAGDQVLIATLTNKPTITVAAFEVWI